jgi:hypothetical protein
MLGLISSEAFEVFNCRLIFSETIVPPRSSHVPILFVSRQDYSPCGPSGLGLPTQPGIIMPVDRQEEPRGEMNGVSDTFG